MRGFFSFFPFSLFLFLDVYDSDYPYCDNPLLGPSIDGVLLLQSVGLLGVIAFKDLYVLDDGGGFLA